MYKLEQRRAEAEAVEKEMKARAEELKAQAAEEEVELQRAVREAVDEGKIKDVVDLYKLQNLQIDKSPTSWFSFLWFLKFEIGLNWKTALLKTKN